MTTPLYTLEILRLAAATADFPRLATPHITAERRAALCGSRITVDLRFDDQDRVVACGLEVRACALGQAAAATLAHTIVGCSAADLAAMRDGIIDLLEGRSAACQWPHLDPLAVAAPYPARHAAIRLPFEAAAEAARLRRAAA